MGGGKRAHGRPGGGLGKSLQAARDKTSYGHRRVMDTSGDMHIHASEIHRKEAHVTDLKQSSTEPDHVSDFLATVQMAQKQFEVERPEHHQLKIINPTMRFPFILTRRLSGFEILNNATLIFQKWLVSRHSANIFHYLNFSEEYL